MRKIVLMMSLALSSYALMAQGRGDWSGSYTFPSNGVTRHSSNLVQADLIEKKEAGYYDGLGKTTLNTYQFTTYSVGSLNQSTATVVVTGNNNQVGVDAGSSSDGNIDGSVDWTQTYRSIVDKAPQ